MHAELTTPCVPLLFIWILFSFFVCSKSYCVSAVCIRWILFMLARALLFSTTEYVVCGSCYVKLWFWFQFSNNMCEDNTCSAFKRWFAHRVDRLFFPFISLFIDVLQWQQFIFNIIWNNERYLFVKKFVSNEKSQFRYISIIQLLEWKRKIKNRAIKSREQ